MGDYKFRFRDERKPVSGYRLESDKDLTGNLERMRSYIYKFTYLKARDDEQPLLFSFFHGVC